MDQVKIRIASHLDINWDQWIQDFTFVHGVQGETILIGPVQDQAELYGLIAKLRDLGVRLISVNMLGDDYSVED